MKLFLIKIQSLSRLGILNVFNVLIYRFKVKFGISSACSIKQELDTQETYFDYPSKIQHLAPNENWNQKIRLFDYHSFDIDPGPPNWFMNYLNKRIHKNKRIGWWKIKDFDENVGDIKGIWELSRMDWLIPFAQQGIIGNKEYIDKLNIWIGDWVKNNQPYRGPNWKCGQETSIRVINLAATFYLLDQKNKSSDKLCQLIELHLERIKPTIKYALAQNNNHGTSEAAALFIGGSLLKNMSIQSGKGYMDFGRKLIEERVCHLIDDTGAFSQYSSNYHRLMLDTLSFIEIWRNYLDEDKFTETFYLKAKLSTDWLKWLIFDNDGRTPNLGANDGSKLFQTNNSSYLDFRPSVNLASNLFKNESIFDDRNSTKHLEWLRVEPKTYKELNTNDEKEYESNGFFILKKKDINLLFRNPYFKFRPSQSDLLHLDIWFKNKNILIDSGSYSYNSSQHYYYSGVASHNTIEFDDRDQMPRLTRFLYGAWPKHSRIKNVDFHGKKYYLSSYKDYKGCVHKRFFRVSEKYLNVIDEIRGFKNKAVLRWHIDDENKEIKQTEKGIILKNKSFDLQIETNSEIKRYELKKTKKSLHYFDEVSSTALEVEFDKNSQISSSFRFVQ